MIVVAGIVAAAVVVAVLGVTAFLVLGDGDAEPSAAAVATSSDAPVEASTPATPTTPAAPASTAPPTPTPTPTPSPAAVPATGPGDVRALPAGRFCRDLQAGGYSYVAAVDYWRANGQPTQMDEDGNGIPCQTVYSPLDVSSYWGTNTVPQQVVDTVATLPSGLFCRDLYAQGYSYTDAVSYWYVYGQPDQMDADVNGIPCETVYPRALVDDFWF